MPYKITKLSKPCRQSDNDKGNWRLTYTDKKGKKHTSCHTSKKNAQGQIAAIEIPKEASFNEEDLLETIIENLLEINHGDHN